MTRKDALVQEKIFHIAVVVSIAINIIFAGSLGHLWKPARPFMPSVLKIKYVRLLIPPVVPQQIQVAEKEPNPLEILRVSRSVVSTPKAKEKIQVTSKPASVRVRYAYERMPATVNPPSQQEAQVNASPQAGAPAGGSESTVATAVDTAPVTTTTNPVPDATSAHDDTPAMPAEAVQPQTADMVTHAAADLPVVTTAVAQTSVAPPAATPQSGTSGSSLPSASTGTGGGTGSVAGVSGSGDGSGGGTGTGDGTGPGSGGLFGIGSGGPAGGQRHIVYLLDVSPSMRSRIDRARDELRQSLATLQSGESFDIIAFGGSLDPMYQGMVAANPYTVGYANGFLNDLELMPYTNISAALQAGLQVPGVNVIVLITDGVPTSGITNFNQIVAGVHGWNKSGAKIYTIGLVGKNPDGSDSSFQATQLLQQLASDSGGQSKIAVVGIAESDD